MTETLKPSTTTKRVVPIQAKLLIVVIVCGVVAVGAQIVKGRRHLERLKDALPVMDSANAQERLARAEMLSAYAMAEQIRGVTHDRANLTGALTVKDGYTAMSLQEKETLHRLAYFAAFGLPDSTTDFQGKLTVQTLSGENIADYRLANGQMQAIQ